MFVRWTLDLVVHSESLLKIASGITGTIIMIANATYALSITVPSSIFLSRFRVQPTPKKNPSKTLGTKMNNDLLSSTPSIIFPNAINP